MRSLIRDRLADPAVTLKRGERRFWAVVSAEGIWTNPAQQHDHLWEMRQSLGIHLGDPVFRAELLALLRPFLRLEPDTWRRELAQMLSATHEGSIAAVEDNFSQIAKADVDIVGGDNLRHALKAEKATAAIDKHLASIADDLTSLLKAALDLWALVDQADGEADPGLYHQPSIRPHEQNRGFHNWTLLIDLVWRAWRSIDQHPQWLAAIWSADGETSPTRPSNAWCSRRSAKARIGPPGRS